MPKSTHEARLERAYEERIKPSSTDALKTRREQLRKAIDECPEWARGSNAQSNRYIEIAAINRELTERLP